MRIHLPLHPRHFEQPSAAGPSTPPVYQLGGELVIIELQGELSWEGDKSDGVVGVIGLERPDKPTLHLGAHHLLHGKFVNLQKPYAVIRKAIARADAEGELGGTALEGDASEEEDVEVDTVTPARKRKPGEPTPSKIDQEEEEEDGPLFAPDPQILATPAVRGLESSSPFFPSSVAQDYSSDLDPSSPAPLWDGDEDEDEDEEEMARQAEMKRRREMAREKRKLEKADRTRHYEVVGIVRKKVLFALRPEPIVTATVLPD